MARRGGFLARIARAAAGAVARVLRLPAERPPRPSRKPSAPTPPPARGPAMRLLGSGEAGPRPVAVPSRHERSLLGSYWNAAGRYLATGDETALRRFRGVTVAGVELEADPFAIEDLALAGLLDFEDIYEYTL